MHENYEDIQRMKRRRGIWLVCATLAVVLGLIGFYIWAEYNSPRLDKNTLCPTNPRHKVPEQRAILIDASDVYSKLLQDDIHQKLNEIYAKVPKYTRISVYTIHADTKLEGAKPDIMLCNPGDGSDLSGIVDNPTLVRAKWGKNFKQRLNEIIKVTFEKPTASQSPIMEQVLRISVLGFDKQVDAPRKLYIFSDMLQNTDSWSHYWRNGTSWEDFKKSDSFVEYIGNFREIDVHLRVITRKRAKGVQNRRLMDFWENYFAEHGGRVRSIHRLTGAS